MISADYAQIELRILAHLSKEDKLIEILTPDNVNNKNGGGGKPEIFRQIAANLFCKKDPHKITSEERDRAKRVSYGIIYGMGSVSLARELEISEDEASTYIAAFKREYPRVREFMERTEQTLRQKGFVETIAGRRRNFLTTDRNSSRQAFNTTCQGSAADLIKLAMVNVSRELELAAAKKKSVCRLVLQIHDELLFEVEIGFKEEAKVIIRMCMENAIPKLIVPVPVNIKEGESWGEMK